MKASKTKWLTIAVTVLYIISTIPFAVFADEKDDEIQRLKDDYDQRVIQNQNLQQQLDELREEVKDGEEPHIALISGNSYSVEAGMRQTITFDIKNVSTVDAVDVLVQAAVSDENDKPLTVSFLNDSNNVNYLSANSTRTLSLEVYADPDSESKSHKVTLKYYYSNRNKKTFTSTSDSLTIRVINETFYPVVSLSNFQVTPQVIQADGTATLKAVIQNTGKKPAQDVQLVVDGLKTDEITMQNTLSNMYFDKLDAAGKKELTFQLKASEDIISGNYPLTFKLTYKDADREEYTNESTYFISAVAPDNEERKSMLRISNMQAPNRTYEVGDPFSITFNMTNTSNITAKNIKITAKTGDTGAVVPRSASVTLLEELRGGASQSMEFVFAASSSAKSQNYPIEFFVEFEDGTKDADKNPNIFSFSQFAGVNIYNPDEDDDDEDDKKSVPKIIVNSYQCDPMIVRAGEEFDLNMTFLNTHSEKPVKNIKMFLTMTEETDSDQTKTGNVFTPVNSSNTFYADYIAPKGTFDKQLRLYTVPDVQPKNYTLTVNFEYEDADNNAVTGQELLGINVTQPTRIENSEIILPSDISMDQPLFISFEIRNTGNVTANNLTLKIGGNFTADQQSTYLSNFESGYSEYYENQLYPMETGQQTLLLSIEYDTPSGERIVETYDYMINVMEPVYYDPEDMDFYPEEPESTPFYKNLWIIGGVAVVAVAAGAAVYIVRKKRRMQRMLEDE